MTPTERRKILTDAVRLDIRCSAADKAMWDEAAAREGMTLSLWIRRTLNLSASGAPAPAQPAPASPRKRRKKGTTR